MSDDSVITNMPQRAPGRLDVVAKRAPQAEEPPTQVEDAMVRLQNQIEELTRAISELLSRLTPIVRVTTPGPTGEVDTLPDRVELAHRIDVLTDQLKELWQRADGTLARLEL